MVNFPTQIPINDSHSPALLDLFVSSDSSVCSAADFSLLGNSDHVGCYFSLQSLLLFSYQLRWSSQ